MNQLLLRIITCFQFADLAIHIRVYRESRKSFLWSMCLRIIGISEIIEAYAPLVFLHSLRNSGITENSSTLQVLLLGIEPRRESLSGATGIRTGIDIDLRFP